MDWITVEESAGIVAAILGTIILLAGFVLLLLKQADSYGVIGAGLGFLAGGLGFEADSALRSIRHSEIDEKIAVLSGFGSNQGGLILSNLRALERIAKSATKAQACQIATEGKNLLARMKATNLTAEAEEGEKILNRLLKRHSLTL